MNINQFKQILNNAAKGTEFEAENIKVYRYNDKRKQHRRLAFKTLGLKYSTLFQTIADQLAAEGYSVQFENTKHIAYGTVVSILITLPLEYSCKNNTK